MSAEQEIVRSAKIQTPSQKNRSTNFLDLSTPDPSFGFGKRTPKPKLPKGASPPPTPNNNKSRVSRRKLSIYGFLCMNSLKSLQISLVGQKKSIDAEIIQQKAPKITPKTSK